MCEAVVTLSREVSKQDELINDDEICWICHEGNSNDLKLESPCQCRGMKAHASCLARWQLQQAGRPEERFCRFCKSELPDWRDGLSGNLPKAAPIMKVVHNEVTHQVTVEPGVEGKKNFERQIRKIFNLGEQDAIQLTFGCRVPGTAAAGTEITLEGWEAFDAAVHCAAVSAGQRMSTQHPGTDGEKSQVNRRKSSGLLRRLFSKTSADSQ